MRAFVPALLALVAVVVLLCAPLADAYNVGYTIVTSSSAVLAIPGESGCGGDSDTGMHMAMPPTAYGQQLAAAVAAGASASYLPLGGEARTAQCSDENCTWVWNDGLFYDNPFVFFNGIVVANSEGNLPVSLHTDAVNGTIYCNFDSCAAQKAVTYPAYDDSQSYWGNRKVAMRRTSGAWENIAYNTTFTQWLCETYYFQVDSVTNDSARFGLAMFPPSRGGVAYPPIDISTFEYCPNAPKKRITEKSGRWLYPNCNSGFPWWGGLIIAIVCFIIVVALIIIIWCCCLRRRNAEEEKRSDNRNRTQRDNTGNVLAQSQLGMSRASTLTGGYADDEYSDEEGGNGY